MIDKEALALRNWQLATEKHLRTHRQNTRGALLWLAAHLPVSPASTDGRTILLIRPDHLGDVLLTGPAIRALAQAQPGARLVALVGPWSAGVISAFPEIALTLTLPFPGFSRNPTRTSIQPYLLAVRSALRLRQVRASTAILFRPDHWWGALLVYLAGVPERVGFDLPDVAPFLSRAISFCPGHAVERNLALVAPWTGPINPHDVQVTFPVEEVDRQDVRERLAARGFPDGAPRVVIHPGSGTLVKQWSVDHWAHVADRLAVQWGAPIIFTGGDHELLLIQHITDRMASPAIILAGETTVGQLAALYAGAKVVLGPDSGPLHLAAAVGTPTVHLYGPADPAEFGPWGDPARHAVVTGNIGCRPCRILDWPDDDPACHPCVRDIPPEAVLAAALRVTSS